MRYFYAGGGLGLVCWLVVAAGCSEPGLMPLDEFVAMQKQQRIARAEETQQMPMPQNLDRYLARYRLSVNDLLDVVLTGIEGPQTGISTYRVRVNNNGEIDLPLVGSVKVGDMELTEAEDAVQAAYVPQFVKNTTVNIQVVQPDLTNVVVAGAATVPGVVPLFKNQRNILYAVAAAGGVSPTASGVVELTRVRKPNQKETFDLGNPIGLAAALEAGPLESGDIVQVVPAAPNTIFVGGLVNAAGVQVFPNGVPYTLLQVLASAGGLRPDVLPHEGRMIRHMPDGTDVRVKLNLDRIMRGVDPNIELAAGDILWVPDTLETRLIDFVNRNLFFRAGYSFVYTQSGSDFINSAAQRQAFNNNLQQSFDPLGFLNRNASLNALQQGAP